jgi:hypothetical protein
VACFELSACCFLTEPVFASLEGAVCGGRALCALVLVFAGSPGKGVGLRRIPANNSITRVSPQKPKMEVQTNNNFVRKWLWEWMKKR